MDPLPQEKFDYIFFTGSGVVGKKVREAANRNLTPVTLELGGKCPVWVDATADINMVARRLLWAKCINLGQTCIAPDYLICPPEVQTKLLEKIKDVLFEWYGKNPQSSENLCRIINERNWHRLNNMLHSTKGKVAIGGDTDQAQLYISPTVITEVSEDEPMMQEEIFGPLLPILTMASPQDAVKFIVSRDKPLRWIY